MIWGLFLVFVIWCLAMLFTVMTLGVGAIIGAPVATVCVLIWIGYYGMVKGKWVFWDNWDSMKVGTIHLTPTPIVMMPRA